VNDEIICILGCRNPSDGDLPGRIDFERRDADFALEIGACKIINIKVARGRL